TQTDAPHRVLVAHRPGHLIEAVHVLLDVKIARKPGEVEPVAHLPFHIAPALLASAMPERAGVVIALHGNDVADGAVVDAGEGFAHGRVITPAQARDDR